jgi:transcriptional regulator with XRE-family HTH domain
MTEAYDERWETGLYKGTGSRMREKREKDKKTVEVFAAELGVSKQALLGYEDGTRRITLHLLVKAAQLLKVSVNFLVYGRDNPPF